MFNSRVLLTLLATMVLSQFVLVLPVLAQQADKPKGVNLWQPGDSGDRLSISGWVHDSDNQPIAGAQLRIWQATWWIPRSCSGS
jgi:protocatechuate 3,4-dioxygenase beta subunit